MPLDNDTVIRQYSDLRQDLSRFVESLTPVAQHEPLCRLESTLAALDKVMKKVVDTDSAPVHQRMRLLCTEKAAVAYGIASVKRTAAEVMFCGTVSKFEDGEAKQKAIDFYYKLCPQFEPVMSAIGQVDC